MVFQKGIFIRNCVNNVTLARTEHKSLHPSTTLNGLPQTCACTQEVYASSYEKPNIL